MKNLTSLKDVKTLCKLSQKSINGGIASECYNQNLGHFNCPEGYFCWRGIDCRPVDDF